MQKYFEMYRCSVKVDMHHPMILNILIIVAVVLKTLLRTFLGDYSTTSLKAAIK